MSLEPSNPHFTFGERLGLVLIVEAAALSATAVTSLLLYIGYSAIAERSQRTGVRWEWTPVHYYFLNLMAFELVQATGGLLNVKWILDAEVVQGSLCTAQGAFKNMGDVGVAFTSLAIAVHTLILLVFRKDPPASRALLVVALIWLFVALMVVLSFATHRGGDYYGDTEYWCWITSRYPGQRIALEYFWLWFAAFCSIIIYVFLAFVVTGLVAVSGRKIWVTSAEERRDRRTSSSSTGKKSTTIAVQMLFYPIVYIVTVLPIAIVRFRAFSGSPTPYATTAFSDTLFALSGFFNAVLYTLTRPRLLPRRRGAVLDAGETETAVGTLASKHLSGGHQRGRADVWEVAEDPDGDDEEKGREGDSESRFPPSPSKPSFEPEH